LIHDLLLERDVIVYIIYGLCLAAAVGLNEEQGGGKGYPIQYVAHSVSPFEGRTFPRFRADGNGRLEVFGGFRGDAVR